jgi:hypothetical protein
MTCFSDCADLGVSGSLPSCTSVAASMACRRGYKAIRRRVCCAEEHMLRLTLASEEKDQSGHGSLCRIRGCINFSTGNAFHHQILPVRYNDYTFFAGSAASIDSTRPFSFGLKPRAFAFSLIAKKELPPNI